MMAVLKSCFCYSLRQGSFIIGSYALIVYCVAFAVELWWIVESLLILPAPAYTLCALYFFNFIMAAVLLFGLLVNPKRPPGVRLASHHKLHGLCMWNSLSFYLIVLFSDLIRKATDVGCGTVCGRILFFIFRQRKYLMSWTLMTVLSFFPEAGMVLFMSIYYWPGHKYEYGVIELAYWSIRAMFNIFGAVCVCSLYLTWRDEELILGRLHDLTLANVELESQSIGSVFLGGGVTGLSVLGRQQQQQHYQNQNHNGTLLRGGHIIGGDSGFNKGNINGGGGTLQSKSKSTSTSPSALASALFIQLQLDVDVDLNIVLDNFISGGGTTFGNGGGGISREIVSDMEIDLEYTDDLNVEMNFHSSDSNFPLPPAVHNHLYQSPATSCDDDGPFPGLNKEGQGFFSTLAEWGRYFCICFFRRRKSSARPLSVVAVSGCGDGFGSVGVSSGINGDGKNMDLVIRNGLIGSRSHLNLNTISPNNNSNTALRASLLRMKSEFNPASLFDPASRKHRISELGIAGIGLEPPGQIPFPSNIQRSRSLWNVSNDDYWSRPPPSRPVSMGYVNYAHQLDQQQQLNNFNQYPHHHHHMNELDLDLYNLQHQQQYQQQNNLLNANMRSQSHTHLAGTLRTNLNPLTYLNNNNPQMQPKKKYSNHNGSSLLMTRTGGGGGGWEEMRFQQGRRAQSMDALNMNAINMNHNVGGSLFQQRYYGQNILANAYNHTHSSNTHHPTMLQREWSKSSLDSEEEEEDEDGRSYQDIPL